MSSLLKNFVNQIDFNSYQDFRDNFKILVPENFNFAYDVVDRYAHEHPQKTALVWCDDYGQEKIFNFADLKKYSDKAANFFKKCGIKKGDTVMLTLKSRYEFWFSILALHKLGAITIPATHMLKSKDIVYRIEKANIKMVVCISDNGVPESFDKAEKSLQDHKLVKAMVGDDDSEGWFNFNQEIENASEEFQRPQGKENTRNEDVSLVYFSSGNYRAS